ncbi:hypothetical protein Anapl_11201 [Anas platyrhynchos]|uniref:Uncharacterized protein n=1 Tax=Anas platyrhynchos TaxID=8839 RepID=R0K8A6_ANAPL|nr:hypothetical protein Anapl_11201 [Anas platyrhynchos]
MEEMGIRGEAVNAGTAEHRHRINKVEQQGCKDVSVHTCKNILNSLMLAVILQCSIASSVCSWKTDKEAVEAVDDCFKKCRGMLKKALQDYQHLKFNDLSTTVEGIWQNLCLRSFGIRCCKKTGTTNLSEPVDSLAAEGKEITGVKEADVGGALLWLYTALFAQTSQETLFSKVPLKYSRYTEITVEAHFRYGESSLISSRSVLP